MMTRFLYSYAHFLLSLTCFSNSWVSRVEPQRPVLERRMRLTSEVGEASALSSMSFMNCGMGIWMILSQWLNWLM